MRDNLVHTLDLLLDDLVDGCYIFRETLIHAETQIPIALFTSPERQTSFQLAIYGVWQMTQDGESVAAYIGGKNKDGQLLKKLKQIEGCTVTEVLLLPEKMNLFIEFNDDVWLRLFCSPLRHEAYYLTQQTPELDPMTAHPVCHATRYCVYHKGMMRAKWRD